MFTILPHVAKQPIKQLRRHNYAHSGGNLGYMVGISDVIFNAPQRPDSFVILTIEPSFVGLSFISM